MFNRNPTPQKTSPEWLNAWTSLAGILIALISIITRVEVNFTKLHADSEMIKNDIHEIKGEIYPRNEAEARFNALQDQSQSRDRLLEEKIRYLEKP